MYEPDFLHESIHLRYIWFATGLPTVGKCLLGMFNGCLTIWMEQSQLTTCIPVWIVRIKDKINYQYFLCTQLVTTYNLLCVNMKERKPNESSLNFVIYLIGSFSKYSLISVNNGVFQLSYVDKYHKINTWFNQLFYQSLLDLPLLQASVLFMVSQCWFHSNGLIHWSLPIFFSGTGLDANMITVCCVTWRFFWHFFPFPKACLVSSAFDEVL